MRVNVYAEETTRRVEIVETTADTGATFIGVRFYLESSPKLHHTPNDDDASAVTFWVRSTKDGFRKGDEIELTQIFARASNLLIERSTK